jgi:uncharacterized membrane protein
MFDLYMLLKWTHIGSMAVAFGSNATHLFWLIGANANKDSEQRANLLRLVKKIDDRMAIPAYVVMVGCGVGMWLWRWPWDSSWVIVSLVLTTIMTIMGISFGPFMNRWIRLAREQPQDEARLSKYSRRLTLWWASFVVMVPVILYFMVTKPTFW